MLKQNLFIILSGILAGAAVMGWMRPDSTSAVTEPVPATDAAVPTSPVAENIDLADAANALDVSNSNILKHLAEAALQSDLSALTSGPKRIPKVTLVSPDKAPGVDHAFIEVPVQTVAQGILAFLKNSDQLKDAGPIAIVDLVSGQRHRRDGRFRCKGAHQPDPGHELPCSRLALRRAERHFQALVVALPE